MNRADVQGIRKMRSFVEYSIVAFRPGILFCESREREKRRPPFFTIHYNRVCKQSDEDCPDKVMSLPSLDIITITNNHHGPQVLISSSSSIFRHSSSHNNRCAYPVNLFVFFPPIFSTDPFNILPHHVGCSLQSFH